MATDLTYADLALFSAEKISFHEKMRLLGYFGTPVNAVNATQTLTVAVQPTAGDTFTIGKTVYTFVTNGTANEAGEVNVGTDLAGAKLAIVAAVEGTDGYNVHHADVDMAAFQTNDAVITAKVAGVAANAIATTSDFTSGSNLWTHAHMTGGVDGTIGIHGQPMFDTSYLYFAVADNDVMDKNWRRVSLGSAF